MSIEWMVGTMFLVTDFKKAWNVMAHPKRTFDEEREITGYWPVLRWFLLLNRHCVDLSH
ncbi:MAG: hypothetical protein ACFE89_11650 [Candidatus Hodarchaeota archaeon]